MSDFQKKELKGRMWNEPDSVVAQKGPVHIGGQDRYMTVLKTKVQGDYKYELVQSVGILYLKDDVSKDKAPDIGGPITLHDYHGPEIREILEGLIAKEEQQESVGKNNADLLAKYRHLHKLSKGQVFKFGGWNDHDQESGTTTLSVGMLVSDKEPYGSDKEADQKKRAAMLSQDPVGSTGESSGSPFPDDEVIPF